MKLLDNTGKELMTVSKLEADERNFLVIKGKIFGAMPMTAKLSPEEARAALKMLDLKTIWFILTILLRKSKPAKDKKKRRA
jgi:hypothetical protein